MRCLAPGSGRAAVRCAMRRSIPTPIRRRIGVGIERRIAHRTAARPEPGARHLMRIGFARDCVGQVGYTARMRRRPSSGKARHGQVETAPEKMHRAHFAEKAGAEITEYVVRREQYAPEAVGIVAVVGGVRIVLIEWDAIDNLARHRRDAYVDPERGKRGKQLGEELRHRLRGEHELTEMSVTLSHPQYVVDEVEIVLER